MPRVVKNAAGPITRAMTPQPRPHLPPWHDGIPSPAQMKDWQCCPLGDRAGVISSDQTLSAGYGATIAVIGSPFDEFRQF